MANQRAPTPPLPGATPRLLTTRDFRIVGRIQHLATREPTLLGLFQLVYEASAAVTDESIPDHGALDPTTDRGRAVAFECPR